MNTTVKRMLGESKTGGLNETKPVVVKQRPVNYYVCPHCNEEIQEKSDYVDEFNQTRHGPCGGAFNWPPTDPAMIGPEWRFLLEPKKPA